MLRHDGDRRPLHDAQQLPLLGRAARLVPEQRRAVPVRVERARSTAAAACSARSARARRRSTSTATRNSCSTSTCAGCCPSAPRRSPDSATSTSTARASSTRGGWRRSPGTSAISTRARAASGCSRARAATPPASSAATSFRSTTSSRSISISSIIPERSGIFNLGSGKAATFNAVAAATINACREAAGEARRSVAELVADGAITYIPFPPALAGKYQSFTEADLTRLRAAGYRAPMASVDEGVARYVERLISAPASSA